jgi:hypothetical protein
LGAKRSSRLLEKSVSRCCEGRSRTLARGDLESLCGRWSPNPCHQPRRLCATSTRCSQKTTRRPRFHGGSCFDVLHRRLPLPQANADAILLAEVGLQKATTKMFATPTRSTGSASALVQTPAAATQKLYPNLGHLQQLPRLPVAIQKPATQIVSQPAVTAATGPVIPAPSHKQQQQLVQAKPAPVKASAPKFVPAAQYDISPGSSFALRHRALLNARSF